MILTSANAQNHTLNVATYNLRYDNPGDSLNPWKQRYPVIVNMVQFHDFDIVGTQEGLYHQLQDLAQELPGYAYIGVGRDDGKQAGEYAAIFYKKDKFKLLQKGTFWLSPVTDRPNKGWDAVLPRICTWGEFQDITSGLKFYFFNTHFDHIGVQARRESAKLILSKVKELAGKQPVILTGDFNVDQHDESYGVLNTSGVLKDAYQLADVKLATAGTFNGFDINTNTDSRIDHIFLNNKFHVKRYGILTDSYHAKQPEGQTLQQAADQVKLPSDHYPVMVTLTY